MWDCIRGHVAEKRIQPEKIVQFVQESKVTTTTQLTKKFNCSKKTIFRILKQEGYRTSYNRNSSGITLDEIPKFDDRGLWEHQGYYFSRWGKIKETIQALVNKSKAGLSAAELKRILHVQVYHHLTACARNGMIIRDTSATIPIYYSERREKGQEQQNERKALTHALPVPKTPTVHKDKIIQVLAMAIKHHADTVEGIIPILQAEGVTINEKTVRWIFERYEIEKKGSP